MKAARGALALVICCLLPVLGHGDQAVDRADRSSHDPIVARIGTHAIRAAEVDASIESALFQLRVKEYDLRRGAAENALAQQLVEMAAKAKGITPQAFEQQEIVGRVPALRDDEIKAARARDGYAASITDAQIGARLREERLRERGRALIRELRTRYDAAITMPAPRTHITVPETAIAGSPRAALDVVVFSDFECTFCAGFVPDLAKVAQARKDVRLFLRHVPRSESGRELASAALCADRQGQYWPMVERLFVMRQGVDHKLPRDVAADLGLNADAFQACRRDADIAAQVDADSALARTLNVSGTPTMYVAGRQIVGVRSMDALHELLDEEVARLRKEEQVTKPKSVVGR